MEGSFSLKLVGWVTSAPKIMNGMLPTTGTAMAYRGDGGDTMGHSREAQHMDREGHTAQGQRQGTGAGHMDREGHTAGRHSTGTGRRTQRKGAFDRELNCHLQGRGMPRKDNAGGHRTKHCHKT